MTTTTPGTSRTARLLALMTKGDNAFNARDFAAVDAVRQPDMVAYITGLAEPVYVPRLDRRPQPLVRSTKPRSVITQRLTGARAAGCHTRHH